MKTGILIYDCDFERLAIDDGENIYVLNCGHTLEVLENGEWQSTRVEFSRDADEWYLTGVYTKFPGKIPQGLTARR